MKYQIVRTDKADEQLKDIIFYIADDSGSVEIALNYLEKIETAICRLEEFPYFGSVPGYSILRRQGYRVLIVERHLIFYKVHEENKIVTIYAIVDGRREYKNLI
ncbi:type II toxin-antitoxin system RelE/ParE family toxin [Ruminococcus sp. OA3]|uniref:type II toxin-antitoxin system RelE/ParE family toxin n=1 Tax=Ruminococcus sp. OA3 TaxID=2914164 RepID=UPI001F06291C|nr:type II toxin-antitoxin system RelE/ParE family toxin [Ruminococcus sp. OA3]MCH1982716.1 type II toxin-antitoxin system RelE/ParE family toxin [Ruminococcus sp. OA3]